VLAGVVAFLKPKHFFALFFFGSQLFFLGGMPPHTFAVACRVFVPAAAPGRRGWLIAKIRSRRRSGLDTSSYAELAAVAQPGLCPRRAHRKRSRAPATCSFDRGQLIFQQLAPATLDRL